MRSAVLLTLLRLVGMPVAVDTVQALIFKRAIGRALGRALRNGVAVCWRGLSSGMAHKRPRVAGAPVAGGPTGVGRSARG